MKKGPGPRGSRDEEFLVPSLNAINGRSDSTPRIVTLFSDLLVYLIVEEAFREQVAFFSRE